MADYSTLPISTQYNLYGSGSSASSYINSANQMKTLASGTGVNTNVADNALGSYGGLGTDVSSGLDINWGNIGTGLNVASGLASSWLGFQNLALAKDQLSFQKESWQEQFDIQKEEYDYQVEKRDARTEAYAEAKANQQKTSM